MYTALSFDRAEKAPRWIIAVTGVITTIGLVALWPWRETGDAGLVRLFLCQGTTLVTALFCVGLMFSLQAVKSLAPGEPIRRAWLLVAASAASHVACGCIAQLVALQGLVEPLSRPGQQTSLLARLQQFGLAFGGPVPMILLTLGLYEVLRIFRRSGLRERLTGLDWLVLAVVALAGAVPLYHAVLSVRSGSAPDFFKIVNLINGPLLIVTAFEAYLILRCVAAMGNGLIARCWAAFAAAVLLTVLGNVGLWVADFGGLQEPFRAITWYLWFVAAAAFSLGPAYHVAAVNRASQM